MLSPINDDLNKAIGYCSDFREPTAMVLNVNVEQDYSQDGIA